MYDDTTVKVGPSMFPTVQEQSSGLFFVLVRACEQQSNELSPQKATQTPYSIYGTMLS